MCILQDGIDRSVPDIFGFLPGGMLFDQLGLAVLAGQPRFRFARSCQKNLIPTNICKQQQCSNPQVWDVNSHNRGRSRHNSSKPSMDANHAQRQHVNNAGKHLVQRVPNCRSEQTDTGDPVSLSVKLAMRRCRPLVCLGLALVAGPYCFTQPLWQWLSERGGDGCVEGDKEHFNRSASDIEEPR